MYQKKIKKEHIKKSSKLEKRKKLIKSSKLNIKKSKPNTKNISGHSPTLKTIKMVEDILKDLEYYTIKFSELKKRLPKQVNHNTLKAIIRYLEQSGKVYVHIDGITWIYNPSKKLQKAIEKGYEFTPERIEKLKEFIKKYDKSRKSS